MQPGNFIDDDYHLQRTTIAFPSFAYEQYFLKEKVKSIGTARRNALRNDIWKHVKDRFPNERRTLMNGGASTYAL